LRIWDICVTHGNTKRQPNIKMRTKTLLVACAALALSLATSQAQVYSANVVGYVNLNLTNGQYSIISPALDADGTGTNNTIASVIGTNVPTGTLVYALNRGTGLFDTLQYKSSGHPAVTAWYLGTLADNTYPINPGQSVFILPTGNTIVTEVGQVLQGSLTNQYVPATGGTFGLVASQIPLAGGVTSGLNYVPTLGDTIYTYDPVLGYNTYVYKSSGHPAVIGWYVGSTLLEPQLSVGQGCWLLPISSGEMWTTNFTVH
jgi:hypothetical protein